MVGHYFRLGFHSLKRNPVLTMLMVLGIAFGIAASMTALTVFHLMSDPIPWKSDRLFAVRLDNWDPNEVYFAPNDPPDMLTYIDAQALMTASKATHQVAMYRSHVLAAKSEDATVKPTTLLVRATSSDFFPMFEPPFQYGGSWDRVQDTQHARVAVLGHDVNEKLFGGQNSVGKHVRIKNVDYTVTGVLADWHPSPKFFDIF